MISAQRPLPHPHNHRGSWPLAGPSLKILNQPGLCSLPSRKGVSKHKFIGQTQTATSVNKVLSGHSPFGPILFLAAATLRAESC